MIRGVTMKKPMAIKENNKLNYEGILYAIPLILAGILQGGYFVYSSAILTALMVVAITIYILRNKEIHLVTGMNMLVMFIVCFMYFVTALWGVDSGMSLMGGIKFLPLLLYFVLVSTDGKRKERLIEQIPLLGTCMTIFSIVMMQFAVFENSVTVAGRLAGFFQYPNTYALFMLICLIIVVDRLDFKKPDWMWCAYAVVSVLGIIMSGSRTVLALTIMLGIGCFMGNKSSRKISATVLLVGVVLVIAMWFSGIGKDIIVRVLSTNGSTFWGRLLYMRDALKIIITHPFGLGYYGYHYMQTAYQTGVYSVVNVHNELLQLMLDVGIIPAVLFYGMMIKACISKKLSVRNRFVLAAIILHSLFDYDFQFIVMGMVMILFLDDSSTKEISISGLTKSCSILATIGILTVAWFTGMSDFYYMQSMPEKSLKMYKGNTQARLEVLQKADTTRKMKDISDEIIQDNKHVALAYSARAQVCFASGDMDGYISNKLIAIQLAPYQYDEYDDYLKTLAYAEGEYLKSGDTKSAKECVKKAEEIPKLLDAVKTKTSSLGWKINDTPTVVLSYDNSELIQEMKDKVNE